ncbi:MAG: zinc ribbon domain-containing protein [Candidatus Bathyarchaeia archaeon]
MTEDDILIVSLALMVMGILFMVWPFAAGVVLLVLGFLGIIFRSEILRKLTPTPAQAPAPPPPAPKKFCMHCGKEMSIDAEFCPQCGKKQSK